MVGYLLRLFFIIILQISFYVRIFLGLKPLQGLIVLSQYPIPLLHYELPLAALLHLPSSIVSQNTTFILTTFCLIFRCCNEMVQGVG